MTPKDPGNKNRTACPLCHKSLKDHRHHCKSCGVCRGKKHEAWCQISPGKK